jgi:hypothetical protein
MRKDIQMAKSRQGAMTDDVVEALRVHLQAVTDAPEIKKRASTGEAIKALSPEISRLRALGYSKRRVAEMLVEFGAPMTVGTLMIAMREVRGNGKGVRGQGVVKDSRGTGRRGERRSASQGNGGGAGANAVAEAVTTVDGSSGNAPSTEPLDGQRGEQPKRFTGKSAAFGKGSK